MAVVRYRLVVEGRPQAEGQPYSAREEASRPSEERHTWSVVHSAHPYLKDTGSSACTVKSYILQVAVEHQTSSVRKGKVYNIHIHPLSVQPSRGLLRSPRCQQIEEEEGRVVRVREPWEAVVGVLVWDHIEAYNVYQCMAIWQE